MLRRMMSAMLVSAMALVGLAGTASAVHKTYALGGNARYQIGGGLPLPVTLTPAPNGRVLPVPNARVLQTLGPDPVKMTIEPAQLTDPAAPEFAIGVFNNNAALFSVQSNLGFRFPAPQNGNVVFQAGGRTGAPTTTVIPGGGIPGSLRYVATGNQFGGPAQAAISGTAKVWAIAVNPPPCNPGATCIAAKIVANPASVNAAGAAFGFTNATTPVNQVPGIYVVGANSAGTIFFRTPTPNGNPGPTNAANSAGGPWTTGMITVSQPGASGPIEIFTLQGSDGRVNGVGNISLVAGAVSTRTLSGPNGNRGWLNLTITDPGNNPVPAVSSWGLAALMVLIAGSTIWMTRRMFATSH